MSLIVKIVEKPQLNRPMLVGGIPDSGYVAKVAMDHLIKELKAKMFAQIYSYDFPAQVVIRPEGIAELMRNELYYWRNTNGGSDLVLFTADSQPVSPEGAYRICEKVLQISSELGVETVFTVGAHITGTFVESPRAYGTATHLESLAKLKDFGILTMNQGSVTWMNGLLFGLAKTFKMKGVFISGETSGYILDPKAGQVVVEALAKMLGISVDVSALEKRAKETQAMLRSMEKQHQHDQAEQTPPPSGMYK